MFVPEGEMLRNIGSCTVSQIVCDIAAFDLLVKPQIKLLEAPSLRCVEMVYEELVKICHNCTSPVCAAMTQFAQRNVLTTRSGAAKVPETSCTNHRRCV